MGRLVVLVVLRFCLVLGSHQNHNRWKRETEKTDTEYNFPQPKIENVYQAWKPIDWGHPLVDETLHYIPPPLDVVHLKGEPSEAPFSEKKDGQQGIFDERLQAEVYSSEGTARQIADVDLKREVAYLRAIQQSKVVKAVPLKPIPRQQASPRVDNEFGYEHVTFKPLQGGFYYIPKPNPFKQPEEESSHKHRNPPRYNEQSRRRPGLGIRPGGSSPGLGVQPGGSYIPVSLLTTPPTITTTSRPYGEIVNKDFYEFKNRASATTQAVAKSGMKRAPNVVSPEGTENVFPLGNPYGVAPGPVKRLEGVLGPPRPELVGEPGGFVRRRSPNQWEPTKNAFLHQERGASFDEEYSANALQQPYQEQAPDYYPPEDVQYRSQEEPQYHHQEEQRYQTQEGHQYQQQQEEQHYRHEDEPHYRHEEEQHYPHQEAQYGPEGPMYPPGEYSEGPMYPPGEYSNLYNTAPSHHVPPHHIPPQAQPTQDYQLVYSETPSNLQYLPNSNTDGNRCLHGLPSFLRYFCDNKQKKRMDRSRFSERSDANIDAMMMSDENLEQMMMVMADNGDLEPAKPIGARSLEELPQDVSPAYSFHNYSPDGVDARKASAAAQYQFVQDAQYGEKGRSAVEDTTDYWDESAEESSQLETIAAEEYKNFQALSRTLIDTQAPFDYIELESSEPQEPAVISSAGGNVKIYTPGPDTTTTTTTPTTSTTRSTTATPRTSTTTAKPAVPFQYQAPVPGLVPVPGKRQRKRPLVYAKRGSQGAGGVSKPFEYINKLTSILSDGFNTEISVPTPNRRRVNRPRTQLITRRVPERTSRRVAYPPSRHVAHPPSSQHVAHPPSQHVAHPPSSQHVAHPPSRHVAVNHTKQKAGLLFPFF